MEQKYYFISFLDDQSDNFAIGNAVSDIHPFNFVSEKAMVGREITLLIFQPISKEEFDLFVKLFNTTE